MQWKALSISILFFLSIHVTANELRTDDGEVLLECQSSCSMNEGDLIQVGIRGRDLFAYNVSRHFIEFKIKLNKHSGRKWEEDKKSFGLSKIWINPLVPLTFIIWGHWGGEKSVQFNSERATVSIGSYISAAGEQIFVAGQTYTSCVGDYDRVKETIRSAALALP